MRRLVAFLVIGVGAFVCSAHGQDSPRWFSLRRLSLSVHTSYHFSPWKNYNAATDTIAQIVRIDPFFVEPRGYEERIRGDATVEGVLAYEIFEPVQIVVRGTYGRLEAGLEFYPILEGLPSSTWSPAFEQRVSFSLPSLGLGLQYRRPLRERLEFLVTLTADRYFSRLKIDSKINSWAVGPVANGPHERVQADFKKNKFGYRISGIASYHLFGPLQLNAGIEYRVIKFHGLTGSGVFTWRWGYQVPFFAELVEGPDFFGVRGWQDPGHTMPYVLPQLPYLPYAEVGERIPATINLTSLGLSVGLRIQF